MQIKTIGDFRRALRHGPYAWPGGYPVFFLMEDGEAVTFAAAKANRRRILESFTVPRRRDDWRPVALEVNWEDGALFCCHTGERIPSAYAEPDDE